MTALCTAAIRFTWVNFIVYLPNMLNQSDWYLAPHAPDFEIEHKTIGSIKKGDLVHHTEELMFSVPKRYGLVNIQREIEKVLKRSKIQDGTCFVSAMHITAGIYVNDAESGLLEDISTWIEKLVPFGLPYHHHETGEDNADAHLKSFLTNHCVTVPITNSVFHFGTWQRIFYAEYDGLRRKRVLVKVMGV